MSRRYVSVVVALVLVASCSGADQIAASTTCEEYLSRGDEERAAAVRTIGVEVDYEFAGNPMTVLSVDAACGADPDATVGGILTGWLESEGAAAQDPVEPDVGASPAASETSSETVDVVTPFLADDTPYSAQPVLLTDDDGWEYRFEPSFNTVNPTFSKTIENSPPGMARFNTFIFINDRFWWDVVGATPGRNAPERGAGVSLFFPIADADEFFFSDTTVDDISGGQPQCSVTNAPGFRSGQGDLPADAGLLCRLQRRDGQVDVDSGGQSPDDTERLVNSLVRALEDVEPIVVVGFSALGECLAFYFPDGRVTTAAGSGTCQLDVGEPPSQPDAEIPVDMVGNWEGTFYQSATSELQQDEYPMRLSLGRDQPGRTVGSVEFPSIPCVGFWKLRDVSAQGVEVQEFIPDNDPQDCETGWRYTVSTASDGVLDIEAVDLDGNAHTAQLEKTASPNIDSYEFLNSLSSKTCGEYLDLPVDVRTEVGTVINGSLEGGDSLCKGSEDLTFSELWDSFSAQSDEP